MEKIKEKVLAKQKEIIYTRNVKYKRKARKKVKIKRKIKQNKKYKRKEKVFMNQLKESRGITLIALVVTIIVLLILAGVSIGVVLGQDGIFAKAQIATEKTNEGQELDQVRLSVLEAKTNNIADKTELKGELETSIDKVYPGSTVNEMKEEEEINYLITLPNDNQYIVKENGLLVEKIEKEVVDTVKIPLGFHHVTGNTREEGIVIADSSNNFEYVWIPVTKDKEGNPTKPYEETNGELNGKVIQLKSRSSDADTEEVMRFKESIVQNGGYFLGRYEAGKEGETFVCKAGQQVMTRVTQPNARSMCQNIYIENNYIEVGTDIVNSYAWDTAIDFIEACGTKENSKTYGSQSGVSKDSNGPFKTGEAVLKSPEMIDEQCNIYDMAGNCREWSIETSGNLTAFRGGDYTNLSTSYFERIYRYAGIETMSFRPILYWNV